LQAFQPTVEIFPLISYDGINYREKENLYKTNDKKKNVSAIKKLENENGKSF